MLRGLCLFLLLALVSSQLPQGVLQAEFGVKNFRFIHAVSGAGPVDVYINGQLSFPNAPFQTVTSYVSDISATSETVVALVPAGISANATIVSHTFYPLPTSSWTLVWARDAYGASNLVLTPTTETCSSTRSAKGWSTLEFVNLAGDYPFVSVTSKNQGELFPQVNLNHFSGIVGIASGKQAFNFSGWNRMTSLEATLNSEANYVLALWAGPAFPAVATLTEVMQCKPPATDLPTAPVPTPMTMNPTIAQSLSFRSEREWIDAINGHLQNPNGLRIDDYFTRWASHSLFYSYFYPAVVGFQNYAQAAASLKAYLNTVPVGGHYYQGVPTVSVINNITFVISYTYYISTGVITRGVIHKTFTLLSDQKTVVLTGYTHFSQAPPRPVTPTEAANISSLYLAKFVSAASSPSAFGSFLTNLRPTLPRVNFYLTSVVPFLEVCLVSIPADPSSHKCTNDHSAALSYFLESFNDGTNALDSNNPFWGSVVSPSVQGIHIINEDTFVLVVYLASAKGNTWGNMLQTVVFTRTLDGTFQVKKITHQAGAFSTQESDDLTSFGSTYAQVNLDAIQSIISANGGTLESPYASEAYFQGYVVNEYFVLSPKFSKTQESLEVIYRLDSWRELNYTVALAGTNIFWLTPFSYVFSLSYRLNPPPFPTAPTSPTLPPSDTLPFLGHITTIWSKSPTPLALSLHTFSLRVRTHMTPLLMIPFGACGRCVDTLDRAGEAGALCSTSTPCGSTCKCGLTCHLGTCSEPMYVPYGDSCASQRCLGGLTCATNTTCI